MLLLRKPTRLCYPLFCLSSFLDTYRPSINLPYVLRLWRMALCLRSRTLHVGDCDDGLAMTLAVVYSVELVQEYMTADECILGVE